MSGDPPPDVKCRAPNISFTGELYSETNMAPSADMGSALPVGQAVFALRDPSNTFEHTASESSSSLKRSPEIEDEVGIQAKRHRDIEVSGTELNFHNNLGRSWGHNVLIEPPPVKPNSSHSLLTVRQGNQIERNGNVANDGFTSIHVRASHDPAVGSNFLGMNSDVIRQAGLSAQFLRDHVARNQQVAANAMFLAQLGGSGFDTVGATTHENLQWGNHFNGQLGLAASQHQAQQFAAFQSFAQLDQFRQAGIGISQPNVSFSSRMSAHGNPQPNRQQDLFSLLRQINATNGSQPSIYEPGGVLDFGASAATNIAAATMDFGASAATNIAAATNAESTRTFFFQQQALSQQRTLELPLCEEGPIDPYMDRSFVSLGIEEDPNWLSEFHCFVRSDLIEVIRASRHDVKARNNTIAYQQVGIRCRFCAHVKPSSRVGRSSAFPSSLRQIYQSFTMMLRDHFANCDAIPTATLNKFMLLKDKPAQGATDSKRYWIYSATKIGMADSSEGLMLNEQTLGDGARLPPFGTVSNQKWEDEKYSSVSLVYPSDRPLVTEFLFVLMSQVQPIRLTEAECIGNRRSLRVGLPGFGCRYCCEQKRLGLCRMFPARRRTLPSKVNDLHDHLRRCTLCPKSVKDLIENIKQISNEHDADQGGDRDFFDRLWSRLGHPT